MACITFRSPRFLFMLPGFTRTVRRCPVCGAPPDRAEFRAPYTQLDHCGQCTHVFARKTPKKRILRLLYEDYWIRDKQDPGISDVEYGPRWNNFIETRMGIMRRTNVIKATPMRVFEIGYSEGILLHEFQKLGHEALGCEMNEVTANAGIKALGVKIENKTFEELTRPSNYYDLLISFHTVEHLPDLHAVFRKITKILKPDGTLLIEAPTGPGEYTNVDHTQFLTDASLRWLPGIYFESGEVIPDRYTTTHGSEVGSFYAVGRRPKRAPHPEHTCAGPCSNPASTRGSRRDRTAPPPARIQTGGHGRTLSRRNGTAARGSNTGMTPRWPHTRQTRASARS